MTYTVQRGDTLSKIAARFNTTLDALLRANPVVRNPDLISLGQMLQLPAAGPAGLPKGPAFPNAPTLATAPPLPALPPPPVVTGPVVANTWGVDVAALLALHALLDGKVKYGLGDKANPRTTEPDKIKSIDCSGYVRYVLYRASGGKLDCSPKGGSWWQNKWCGENLTTIAYDAANAGASDGKLRIAFYTQGKIDHVWLLHNGKTLESYSGHGVGRKPWADRTSITDVCYVF